MHIKEIFIKKYGKFEDFTLPLERGFNLICGENEAGKSTLHSFIRRIFFGMQPRDRGGVQTNDRVRYAPFTGGNMSGSISLNLGGNENISISRTFGKTAAGDRLSVVNNVTGEEISKLIDEVSPGEILFGCSDKMFEKTLWLRQDGTYMGGNDDEITRRLINLAVSGDEEISINQASENLANLQKALKAPDNRSAPGKIDRLQAELHDLNDERLQFERKRETFAALEKSHAALEKERAGVERTIEEYQKARKSVEAAQKFQIVQKVDEHLAEIGELETSSEHVGFIDVNEAWKLEISEKNRELEEASKSTNSDDSSVHATDLEVARRKKRLRVVAQIFGALAAIGGIAVYAAFFVVEHFVMVSDWILLLIAATGLGIKLLAILDSRQLNKKIAELQAKIDHAAQFELDKSAKIDILKRELAETYAELNVGSYGELLEKSAIAHEYRAKIALLKENVQILLGERDLVELRLETAGYEQSSALFEKNKESIDLTLNNGQAKLLQISEQIQDVKREMNMLFAGCESLAALTGNIAQCEEEIDESRLELDAVKLARQALADAVSEMKNNFTPRLNAAANEIIEKLTSGKYCELRVSEGLNIKVLQDGELIEGEYLSAGAFDQIYFALRMAMIRLLCGENKIIFLDDTFTQYDDIRAAQAFEYILELSKTTQIVMFTCQSREFEMAKKFGNVNVVNL